MWAWLWSVLGMIVAVPTLVVLRVLCDHIPQLEKLGNFLAGALRNPSAAAGQVGNLFVGAALAEALGILVALSLVRELGPVVAAPDCGGRCLKEMGRAQLAGNA